MKTKKIKAAPGLPRKRKNVENSGFAPARK
jgi:hypothetical protein